jgi:hypothetical protein
MYISKVSIKIHMCLFLISLVLCEAANSFEFNEINTNFSILNFIFIIFIDTVSYSANLLYLFALMIYLFFKNKFNNFLSFKIENLDEKIQRMPSLRTESNIKKYNVSMQDVTSNTRGLGLPSAESVSSAINAEQLSYIPKPMSDSELLDPIDASSYYTLNTLTLNSNRSTYIDYTELVSYRMAQTSTIYVQEQQIDYIVNYHIPHRKYYKFADWVLIRRHSPRHIKHLTNFECINQKTKVYKNAPVPVNRLTMLDLDRTFVLAKYMSPENQLCLQRQLRTTFKKKPKVNYDILEDSPLINSKPYRRPQDRYMLGYRPHTRRLSDPNNRTDSNRSIVLHPLSLEVDNTFSNPDNLVALNLLDLEDADGVDNEVPISVVPNDLAIEESNAERVRGLFDISGEGNIAHNTGLNTLIAREARNEFVENLNRVDAGYDPNAISTPARIEVSVCYDPVTLEPSTDIIRYYCPLNNNLLSTIVKPITREELNLDLNRAKSKIIVDPLNNIIR